MWAECERKRTEPNLEWSGAVSRCGRKRRSGSGAWSRRSSSSSSSQVFLEWPKLQRHHEDHYSQSQYSRIRECCNSSGISVSSNGIGRHATLMQAQVRLHWTAWRSNLSSVNSRRSCFSCCWCKGVERPAKWCDISFVAGGVQEQAQDALVKPLLRNCSTLNDTFSQ